MSNSPWFGNVSACSGKIPVTVFITPWHFHVFRRLPERANFPRRHFGPEQNLNVEMNSVTPSADCLHRPADIIRTSRLFSRLLHLPKTILEASALRTASGMFGEPSAQLADSAKDIKYWWRSNMELIGKLSGILQITKKPWGSNAEGTWKAHRSHKAIHQWQPVDLPRPHGWTVVYISWLLKRKMTAIVMRSLVAWLNQRH